MSSFDVEVILQIVIGSVWVFHGFYSKLLNGIPRHRMIVGKILGDQVAGPAARTIGCLEVLVGVWAYSGFVRVDCAVVQTLAIVSMNTLEIAFARSLLISPLGMVILNLVFLAAIWRWASFS
jgi:hypothetical protein